MMYIHYCPLCQRIHMLNGHKQTCPKCRGELTELKIDYLTFSKLDAEEREHLKAQCADPEEMGELKTSYRMYKYSKWYKKQHEKDSGNKNPFSGSSTPT